jgi:Domain of unknown function (DUF4062)
MARPRVFLSSTYYDLKNVRVALSAFIKQQGYEPILNEVGSISYGKHASLESYCYQEVRSCDILVAIIGGRYGSASKESGQSISQTELKTALESGKQVYIFIERDVASEFTTYQNNKVAKISWAHVDNPAVYAFIEEVKALPNNNAIFPFETSQNIIEILREQWAGLFHRLLNDRAQGDQYAVARELNQGLSSVRGMIDALRPVSGTADPKLSEISAIEHPLFARLKRLLKAGYRVFFISKEEMHDWLKSRNWVSVDPSVWDEGNVQEWFPKKEQGEDRPYDLLKIDNALFDEDGLLKAADDIPWNDQLVRIEKHDPAAVTVSGSDDDI